MEQLSAYDTELKKQDTILQWDNIRYIPKPNIATTYLTDELPPIELTPTSFAVSFFGDFIILANNKRRGMEFPGGHLEENETIEDSTLRELYEETGAIGTISKLLCVRRHESFGTKPIDYDYEFPVTYMPFFIVEISTIEELKENDECINPYILPIVDGKVDYTGYEKEWEKFISVYESNILIEEAIKKRR